MRRFQLIREHDVTGVSGTGLVAEGVLSSNGHVVVFWLTHRPSVVIWESVDDLMFVSGHGGFTTLRWVDTPENETMPTAGST